MQLMEMTHTTSDGTASRCVLQQRRNLVLRQFKIHVFIAVSLVINQDLESGMPIGPSCHFSSSERRFDVANEFRVFLTHGTVLSALIEWNKDSHHCY
ncbi:hypothetical protein CDAR_107031 [Caerostris darwini]|uniref:Uncharacterized protein n=1 Tax=Caerostris darwini TaxID=1538125 RepID=A0AAV4SV07_9ARAC|nr:hypothetical protein CDAR_107031 [Caerostris darwini]